MDSRDLRQAELVDLVGAKVGGRVIADQRGILGGAIGEAPDAVVGAGEALLRFHQRDDAAVGGADIVDQGAAAGLDQLRLFRCRDVRACRPWL